MPRRESIVALAETHRFEAPHALHVERLAGSLFDQIAPVHGAGALERELLCCAAILHDIGETYAMEGHHRRALALILAAPLPLFTDTERRVIANIARYHRKALPAESHAEFIALNETDRRTVRAMAALLRIADALDRRHLQLVRQIHCIITTDCLVIEAAADVTLEAEAFAAARKSDLFRQQFGLTTLVR